MFKHQLFFQRIKSNFILQIISADVFEAFNETGFEDDEKVKAIFKR